MGAEEAKEWHLDRKVSIGIIIAVLGNVAYGAWTFSALNQRVAALESAISQMNGQSERIARLESRLDLMSQTLTGIDAKFDRLLEMWYGRGIPTPHP